MRFHSTVYDEKNQQIFECHVFADSPGEGSKNVKEYLQGKGIEGAMQLEVWSVVVRDDIATELPII